MGDQSEAAQTMTGAAARNLRELPSVDRVMNAGPAQRPIDVYGRKITLEAVRQALDECRGEILNGTLAAVSEEAVLTRAETALRQQFQPTLRPVINATGVIIHTNLGRALMSQASIRAASEAARGYSTLEYDLEAGARGSRSMHAERLIKQLTGAEAAHSVNNNAAAILLMLTALCHGKEVIISRGQLIEIGGGFRVPDVMAQSGARLVEVGTTNRTHAQDYVNAIGEDTAAILVAHHSNFQIVGFTSEPALDELSEIARERGILLLYDQGSGAVDDMSRFGLTREVTVQEALLAGADIVGFSGDKLLGGPQAGILCGKAALVSKIKRHPLARAVRADKMCLAALSETLRAHVMERAESEIPVWQMIAITEEQLKERAERWIAQLKSAGIEAALRPGYSTVGGGSLPGSTLSTWLVAPEVERAEAFAKALRATSIPVIGRITDDRLHLDPRTVLPEQEQGMLQTIVEVALAMEESHARA